jgi:hypothetical protein
LVGVAFAIVFTSNFNHDIVVEENTGTLDDALEPGPPDVILSLFGWISKR